MSTVPDSENLRSFPREVFPETPRDPSCMDVKVLLSVPNLWMNRYKKTITSIFIALYPIVPSYTRIAGVPVYKLLVITYALAYLFVCRIPRRNIGLIVSVVGLWIIANLYHFSASGLMNVVIDYILVMIPLLDYFTSKEKVEEGLEIILKCSMLMCICGISNFITKKNIFSIIYNGSELDATPDLQMRGTLARSEASFAHAIPFGIYLSVNALFALYFYNKTKEKKYKYMFILLVITLLTTISRAPILIFFAVVLLFLGMMGLKKLVTGVIRGIAAFVIMLAVLYFALPNVFNNLSFIVNAVLGIFSDNALARTGAFEDANPFTYRLSLYSSIGNLLSGHWIFGNGSVVQSFYYGNVLHSSIDNAYLAWLVRYGLVGLLANVIPLAGALIISFKRRKKDRIYILFFAVSMIFMLNWFSVARLSEARLWAIVYLMIWGLRDVEKVVDLEHYRKLLHYGGEYDLNISMSYSVGK